MKPIQGIAEEILIFLAERGALAESIKVSTINLAKELKSSQQTISRILIKLERDGYIERRSHGRVKSIKLTEKAVRELMNKYLALRSIFEKPIEIRLKGRVFRGLSEGAYYLKIPHYVNQFKEKLGYIPYPGTLNLKLIDEDSIMNRILLKRLADIKIEGFSDERRSYGGARCIKARLDDEEVAIVFVDRTHYGDDVVEVIAPVCLRDKLGLKDGDKVSLKITLSAKSLHEIYASK